MGKIRMLSDSIIGKIAAGEVVERPVAAMKELIENSLDAGASAITAEIREGGISYIRVTDNGCGIDESDLKMAFERHATSKISREPDLYSIQTLGFRGEALASISAVSHVVMTTRTAERDAGLKVTNEGGIIKKIEEAACTVGTTIIVTDLFFNTPVRKGFMKKASAEAGAVHDLMDQFILSRPDVSFRYICDGKTLRHSPGDGQNESAAMTVFGGKAMKNMREVNGHVNGVIIKGYVGIGENARGNRSQEYFFINGRMMHSSILSSALETACRERVMIGKFPICALHLGIAYDAVDVNVHPNKLEVRFRDEAAVGEAVQVLTLEALKDRDAFEKPVEMLLEKDRRPAMNPAPSAAEIRKGLNKPEPVITTVSRIPDVSGTRSEKIPSDHRMLPESKEKKTEQITNINPAVMNEKAEPLPFVRPVISEKTPQETPASSSVPTEAAEPVNEKTEQVNTILPEIRQNFKVFGALFNTFILIEYGDQLLMVDQHAVHERILFDRLMKENQGLNMGQELLVPYIISVSPREITLIEENRELLESIGFVIEAIGEHEAVIRMIPVILGKSETAEFARDILNEMDVHRNITLEKKRAELLQTACKHAIKGGESLTHDQIQSLVDEMITKKVTPTCPHGRPLVISITRRELDKKFKRIQE